MITFIEFVQPRWLPKQCLCTPGPLVVTNMRLSSLLSFVRRTYANLVRQAKSKQKILDKMYEAGLTKPVQHRATFTFQFPDCDKLPPPVLPFVDVSFSYSGKEEDMLYRVILFAAISIIHALHTFCAKDLMRCSMLSMEILHPALPVLSATRHTDDPRQRAARRN